MMPLSLFRSRTFAGANLLTLWLYAALGGALFFLPFDLIQVHGYSATAAGAALLPFVLLMFTLSRWSGGLVDRYGARLPLIVGPAIAAAGFALFALPGLWRRQLLDDVLPRHRGPGLRDGDQRGAADHDGDGRGGRAPRRHRLRHQQRRLPLRRAPRRRRAGHPDARACSAAGSTAGSRGPICRRRRGRRWRRSGERLAALEIPAGLARTGAGAARAAVDRAFLDGFRGVMLTAAGLALLASLSAAWLIEKGKGTRGIAETAGRRRR